MEYQEAHEAWLAAHLRGRSGERRGRLQRGHGHGEKLFLQKVWWPLHGSLDDLVPEYEVMDWRGRPFFMDFVWMPGRANVAFEIKGYGPHVQETDRQRYCNELNRETFLQGLGYRVVSIPYDDVERRPELVISLLRVLCSRVAVGSGADELGDRREKEVLTLAYQLSRPVRPADVVQRLGMNHRTAVNVLRSLCGRGKLRPIAAGSSGRIMGYGRVRSFRDDFSW